MYIYMFRIYVYSSPPLSYYTTSLLIKLFQGYSHKVEIAGYVYVLISINAAISPPFLSFVRQSRWSWRLAPVLGLLYSVHFRSRMCWYAGYISSPLSHCLIMFPYSVTPSTSAIHPCCSCYYHAAAQEAHLAKLCLTDYSFWRR